MSCEVKVKINDFTLNLDEGLAETIVILNEKGYITTCCCEGHKQFCEGYAQPKRRQEYGQYWPIWIEFQDGYLPPYSPNIYPHTDDYEGWKNGHAREFMGLRKVFKNSDAVPTLLVSFEAPKRERKKFSDGDVDKEHKRALELVLAWAKGLPRLEEYDASFPVEDEMKEIVETLNAKGYTVRRSTARPIEIYFKEGCAPFEEPKVNGLRNYSHGTEGVVFGYDKLWVNAEVHDEILMWARNLPEIYFTMKGVEEILRKKKYSVFIEYDCKYIVFLDGYHSEKGLEKIRHKWETDDDKSYILYFSEEDDVKMIIKWAEGLPEFCQKE
ncbi:hypothetical protein [Pseudobutyrivibrio ruminis]|uniref:hypothetical protein n=1 Tax=Pseudobutyrivibrio ruminis TaxID=46206 RepID=UPI000409443E|nr:hypothetical protein [Pseudobutyrivibrio ruminis]